MENRIITSRQTFEEKLDNPHQRFKFHSLLIFGFTGVSISYFEPIFSTFIYLSTLLNPRLFVKRSGMKTVIRQETPTNRSSMTYSYDLSNAVWEILALLL
jgi:hypothetical protein